MNSLEILLRRVGRELADRQVARFWKVPEEMVQTPCDFFGYTRTGRAILIEAKSVQRPRLPLRQAPGLLPHQWNELCDAARAGACALIVWRAFDRIAVLHVRDYMRTTEKSIAWDKNWAGHTKETLDLAIECAIYDGGFGGGGDPCGCTALGG